MIDLNTFSWGLLVGIAPTGIVLWRMQLLDDAERIRRAPRSAADATSARRSFRLDRSAESGIALYALFDRGKPFWRRMRLPMVLLGWAVLPPWAAVASGLHLPDLPGKPAGLPIGTLVAFLLAPVVSWRRGRGGGRH